MDQCCRSIAEYDHASHMNLISQDVEVLGVPGFDVIGYADWYAQCEYEFNEKLIAATRYDGLEICDNSAKQIRFLTQETVNTTDGTIESHPLEVELTLENDGAWRVTRERLLSSDEASELGIAR